MVTHCVCKDGHVRSYTSAIFQPAFLVLSNCWLTLENNYFCSYHRRGTFPVLDNIFFFQEL